MLESLRIIDYALIDDLLIEFEPGLNIFTGSTGAGKTIIFGALGLVLGERGSEEVIRTGAKAALVEAEFSVAKNTQLPVDDFSNIDTLIINREIKSSGRSRIFANNKQTTLQNLKAIGSVLTDITGQHRQKGLTDSSSHCEILDMYAGLNRDVEKLADIYKKYHKLISIHNELEKQQRESAAEKELLAFQIKEIESAEISLDEDKHLGQEKQQLTNAELIKSTCQTCYNSLFDDDGSAIERFKDTVKELGRIARFSDQADLIKDKIDELSINLDDCGISLRDLADNCEFDPARLEIVDDRIALINKLKRKYGRTIDEILQYCEQAKIKANALEDVADKLKKLTDELNICQDSLSQKACDVSHNRKKAALSLEKDVKKHLSDLAMKGSDFKVDITFKENPDGPFVVNSQKLGGSEIGFDNVEFLICPNPGEQLKPLASTASGGELSRVMLSICSAIVDVFPRDTLVFDEIDAGISGEVASQVGKKLLRLARNRQVICITHLQQIASQGEAHFKVYKGKSKGRSVTRVKKLEGNQRVAEIARLLAGEQISDVALDGAMKLLEEGRS